MKTLSKTSLMFIKIWLLAFIFFLALNFISPISADIERMVAIKGAVLNSFFYSIMLTSFFYILYSFIALIADLFKKKSASDS